MRMIFVLFSVGFRIIYQSGENNSGFSYLCLCFGLYSAKIYYEDLQ